MFPTEEAPDDWETWPEYQPEGHTSLDAAGDLEHLSEQREAGRRVGERHPTELPKVVPLSGYAGHDVEQQLRMRHVLNHMRDEDVTLLVDRYVTRLTVQEMADKHGITRQSMDGRLSTAKQNFMVAFADHWLEDPVVDIDDSHTELDVEGDDQT